MTRLRLVTVRAVILLAASGCGGPSSHDNARPFPQSNRNFISEDELNQRQFSSVYAAIEALRTNWLTLRGPEGQVQVYLDGQYLGGVGMLRSIPVRNVESIQHLDGIEAAARYGLNHDQGAILVSTHYGGP
jgi:hypothetical protein